MSPLISKVELEPIGYVHCSRRYRFEAPRQGVYAPGDAIIKLQPGQGYEEGLSELEGFSHIWVHFVFHLNETWHPKVKPPVPGKVAEVGVFASRSPHRPNRLGLSCVELVDINGLELHIRNHDLLDLTPVLDIKPYVAYYDSFPDAGTGWLPEPPALFRVEFTLEAEASASVVLAAGGPDLKSFCQVQLGCEPLNPERKKLEKIAENRYAVICRGHRVAWEINLQDRLITVLTMN
jgi:tRNA (adenine37-N6)-methyltransferase